MGILRKLSKRSKKDVPEKEGRKAQEKEQQAAAIVKEEKPAEASVAKEISEKTSLKAYKYLVKPVISEKAMDMKAGLNKYVFEVSLGANKIEISKAIEELYGIKPISINIVSVKGKNVRYGRNRGKMKDWKKAIVTLKEGDSIEVVEGV